MQVPPNCDLTLGLTCLDKSVPGRTTWQMHVDERFSNPAGLLQGGFLAALCDSAMGASAVTFALQGGSERVSCANAEMKVSFFCPVVVGADLTCAAEVVSGGKRLAFCEAEVHDGAARLVARASSTYVVSKRERRPLAAGC